MPNHAGPRPRTECLAYLAAELAWFRSLSATMQHEVDRRRFIATEETHALLAYHLEHGRFADEACNPWVVVRPVENIAA